MYRYIQYSRVNLHSARTAGLVLLYLMFLSIPATVLAASTDGAEAVKMLAEKLAFSNEGQVIEADKETIYISLGQEDGIPEGSQFEVVRLGEPLRVGEEILGYKETPIGKAEAFRVRKKMTLARLLDSSEPPKKGDKVYQLKKQVKRVVVAQFQDGQGLNQLTKSLQRRLSTDLINKGMQVIERDQLERVLREQKLGYSGLINLSSAKKVGQLLGAEGIVLGSLGDMGDSVVINARLVDLETGNSLAATETSLPKTPLISRLRETGVEEVVGVAEVSSTSSGRIADGGKKSKKTQALPSVIVKGFTFTSQGCKRRGGGLTCDVLVTSNEDDKELSVWAHRSNDKSARVFDDKGYTYLASEVRLGSCTDDHYCKQRLIMDIPTKLIANFQEVSEDATKVALLEFVGQHSNQSFRAQLRNIPLTK